MVTRWFPPEPPGIFLAGDRGEWPMDRYLRATGIYFLPPLQQQQGDTMKSASKIFIGVLLAAAMTPAMAQKPASKPAARPSAPAPAPAAATGSIQQGQIEAGGMVTWFKTDDLDVGLVTLAGGYMFTDQLEFRADWTMIL